LRIQEKKEDKNRAGRGVAPAVSAVSGSGGDSGGGNEDRRTSFILTWRISERRPWLNRMFRRPYAIAGMRLRVQSGPF